MHLLLAAVAGGIGGFVLMAVVDPSQRSTHLDVWAIAGGAAVGALVYRVLTHWD